MHEVSIAQAIVRSVCKSLAENGRSHASRIRLQIGRFTAIVPEALRFSFQWIAEGTPCENAILEMEEIPIRCKCRVCRSEFTVEEVNLVCPNCNSGEVELLSGRELLIESVEAD